MQLYFKTNSAWVSAISAWFKDNTTWHQAKEVWLNINGSWKKVFGGKQYTFAFGNTVYGTPNGYMSFDNTNGGYIMSSTLGRVLAYFPVDMRVDAMYYAADDVWWYWRFHGQKQSGGTANECRFEVWIPSGYSFAYIYLEAFPSGMSPATTGFWVDGTNTGYSNIGSLTRTAGGKFYVYLNNTAGGSLPTMTPWGYDGAARVSYPWVQLPNSRLVSYAGVTATDDGYVTIPTAQGGAPGTVVSLAVSSVGATGTVVSWNAPSDVGMSFITKYNWQLSSDDGATYGASTTVAQTNTGSAVQSITLGTLTKDVKYKVRVRAYNYLYASTPGAWLETDTISFSAPGDFTWQGYDQTASPTKPSLTGYRGYDSAAWGNQIVLDWASTAPTDTTGYVLKWYGGLYSSTLTSFASGWTSATTGVQQIATDSLGLFPNTAWTPASTTTGGDWSLTVIADTNNTDRYGYAAVWAENVGKRIVRVSWTTSTGAKSYKVSYTLSGMAVAGLNATYTSNVVPDANSNLNTYLDVTLGAQGTLTINSVTAYSSTDATGTVKTAGTLYYNPLSGTFGASAVTPTDKRTQSETNTSYGKFRYYPSVTISAPTQGDTKATINWTSTNQTKYAISGDVTVATTTSTNTSYTATGLTNGSSYAYTVTVTSSDGRTAAASSSSTQALKPVKAFKTPTVTYASAPTRQAYQESATTGKNSGAGQSFYLFESTMTIAGDGLRVVSMTFEAYKAATANTTNFYSSGSCIKSSYFGSTTNNYFLVNSSNTSTKLYLRFQATVSGTNGTDYTMTNWTSLSA